MTNEYIDMNIIKRDGPFDEFKQDISIVSVELTTGEKFHQILLSYPNKIIGMKDEKQLPFANSDIKRVFQTQEERSMRADISWFFS